MACATRTAHLVDFVEPLPYMEILVQRKGICALVAPPAVLLLLFATRNDFADKDGVQYVALTDDGVYDSRRWSCEGGWKAGNWHRQGSIRPVHTVQTLSPRTSENDVARAKHFVPGL
jgi:hypothetical protein